ncbi:MAG: tail fiber domain-containing protein [Caldilineaceae bacterium]
MFRYKYILIAAVACALVVITSVAILAQSKPNTFPASGNVGIGTNSPNTMLHINGTGVDNTGATAVVRIISGNGAQTLLMDGNEIDALADGLFLNNNATQPIVLANGGGNVGIGVTNPTYRLELPDIAGKAGRGRANQWVTYSSREEKQNIVSLKSQDYATLLQAIVDMDLVYYQYKLQNDQRYYLGVIAEEAPEQIVTSDRKGLSLAEFTAFSLAGLKAQQTQIAAQEQQILKLEQEYTKLTQRLAQLERVLQSLSK